jgi:hypothetical protein
MIMSNSSMPRKISEVTVMQDRLIYNKKYV